MEEEPVEQEEGARVAEAVEEEVMEVADLLADLAVVGKGVAEVAMVLVMR